MKSKKTWQPRSFWKVFSWLMTEGIPKPWLEQRTEEYLKALAGEHTMDGVDSQIVVEQILELQEKTGLKATKRDLEKLLSYGAMHLKAYLKIVSFKHNVTPVKNWIGFTHHLAKQPAHELADWYKPKAPPKDETKLEWVKRYLKQNKKKLDFISSEASLNRYAKRETTKPSVLLQLHAKESKSVLKTFQKVRGQWVDRTFPLYHPDFKEVVATHFENCFKEVRVSNAKFFAERARKNRPQKNLNWLKAYLTKQKNKVVFLKSEKQINREAQGDKTKPGILLKIHAEVEKSIFKVVQMVRGEWIDQEFHLGHPEFEKAVTAHLSQGMKA